MRASRLMILLCGLSFAATATVLAEAGPGHVKNGQALYQQNCLRCHGAKLDGKGPDGEALIVRPTNFYKYLSRVKGDLELEETIRRGRKMTAMHEWDSRFNDQQVYDLVAYIRSAVPQLKVKP
jgi:mono/diheme cytochrome c family protein